MKLGKILVALCIVTAVSVFIFGMTRPCYAKTGPSIEDTEGGTGKIEGNVPDNTGEKDKGSPLHAWKAIVAAGKKAGDTITSAEFEGMRNWSASTRGYELRSLVAIGVLAPTDARSKYKLLVDATSEQIDLINNEAKPIVNKISRDGTKTALGIDTWILDVKHLGEGKAEQIAAVVKKVTGSNVTPGAVSGDFVQEDIYADKDLEASVAINGEKPFTVNGIDLSEVEGISGDIEQQALLAAMVDTRIVSPEGKIKGSVVDFSAAKANTVIFKEELLDKPVEGFKAEFDKLDEGQIAVIIAINKSSEDIKTALEQAGLLEQRGNRIIVMGVKADSLAAQAFGRLFGDNNIVDLRGQAINNILENKDLVKGLKGAV